MFNAVGKDNNPNDKFTIGNTGTQKVGTIKPKPFGSMTAGGIGGHSDRLGAYLAHGVTSTQEVGLANDNNNNIFSLGGIQGAGGDNGINVKESTQQLAAFRIAYANFSSNPSPETAQRLKDAYYGAGENSPFVNNKSVTQLYKMKEPKVNSLLGI